MDPPVASTNFTESLIADKSTKWTPADEATLINTLKIAKANAQQADNGWKPAAWHLVVEALKGSEAVSGGLPKEVQPCKTAWQRVGSAFTLSKGFHH